MTRINRGLLIALVFLLASGCVTWKQTSSLLKPVNEKTQVLSTDWAASEKRTLELIQYAEQSEKWRRWARTTYQNYNHYQKSHRGKIASKDLTEIKRMGSRYANELWHPLWGLLRSPYFFMDLNRDVKLQTQRESYIETGVVRYVDSVGDIMNYSEDPIDGTTYEKIQVTVYHINPTDLKGRVFLREFEISFGAALVLADNFVWGWEPYMNNKVIRRNLFYDLQGSHDETREMIRTISENYRKYQNSEKWVAAFDLYEEARRITQNIKVYDSPSVIDPLEHLIEVTTTFKLLSDESNRKKFIRRSAGKTKALIRRHGDGLNHIGRRASYIASKAFGNSAGLFQLRKGKLKHLPEPEVRKIENKLKSLDILFEKTPFRLTDKFIPGHYGHVAVWVGTESELQALGVWEQLPDLYETAVERYSYKGPSFQQSIRNGKYIVEALRSGVQMNSMHHFLDIDDLAVIRPRNCLGEAENVNCLTLEKKKQYLIEAFKQVGKNYDFNFDVNTESEIVCSEMAYRTFVDMDFSTTRTLGKHSMSPDQVALMADDPADPFYPVLLYFDGKYIHAEGDSLRRIFNLLLKKEYSTVKAAIEFEEKNH